MSLLKKKLDRKAALVKKVIRQRDKNKEQQKELKEYVK
jgi:hypothetical protein